MKSLNYFFKHFQFIFFFFWNGMEAIKKMKKIPNKKKMFDWDIYLEERM